MTSRSTELSALVRRRRLQLHLSQRAAAERAGLALGTWSALERAGAEHAFQDLTLARVADALELAVDVVFAAADRRVTEQEGEAVDAEAESVETDELVDDLTGELRRLSDHSVEDFVFAYTLVKELVDHMLRKHER